MDDIPISDLYPEDKASLDDESKQSALAEVSVSIVYRDLFTTLQSSEVDGTLLCQGNPILSLFCTEFR